MKRSPSSMLADDSDDVLVRENVQRLKKRIRGG
jgi:hypothetical protein